MQNVSTEIREFVLMRNDIKNKQQTAKRILDFFLNLESHIIGKSEQDWDRSFDLFTAQGYALLKICEFPSKNAQSYAFRRLMLQERPADSHSHTILMNIQSPEDEINIEVEQVPSNLFRRSNKRPIIFSSGASSWTTAKP